MLKPLVIALSGGALALGIVTAVTVPSGHAIAQDTGQGRGMALCRTDLATFCRGIEAGRGGRVACLAANQDKLAPACAEMVRSRMAEREARRDGEPKGAPDSGGDSKTADLPNAADTPPPAPRAARPADAGAPRSADGKGRGPLAACRADMRALCSNVEKGGGGRVRCLKENQSKVSPACADALAANAARLKEARAACRGDVATFCPQSKGFERRQCLVENQAKLSPACAATLPPKRS